MLSFDCKDCNIGNRRMGQSKEGLQYLMDVNVFITKNTLNPKSLPSIDKRKYIK